MALVLKDRVKETTTTTGTGVITLDGALNGFQTFDAVGNYNQTYYTITDNTNWEAGIGTFGELESSAALSLDFNQTTTLDSRITFTRATNGTYFDSAGVLQTASSGVARFDHRLEGGVWVNKGLLIEEQRTNLCLQSEDLSTTWTNTNTTETTDQTTSPDGTTNADAVFETTTNGNHVITQSFTAIDMITTNYSASCFFKANGRIRGIWQVFRTSPGTDAFRVDFNLSDQTTSTIVGGTAVVVDSSITDVGGGWYRVSVSGRTGQSGTHAMRLLLQLDDGTFSYAGDVTKGMYMWGAQLEAGAFPTSYIKTTTASVQRNADVATMTSTNFSSWYNATEGTILWQGDLLGVKVGSTRLYSVSDGTNNEYFQGNATNSSGDGFTWALFDGGSSQAVLNTPNPLVVPSADTTYKHAAAYKANDFAASLDGIAVSTDDSGTLPTVNKLGFGTDTNDAGAFLNGHIAKFYYWNTRLSNGTLQYLSSSFGSPSISRRLNRDTVLASSNSGNLVNFSAGTKLVFSPLPAIATQGSAATADDSSIGTDLVAWNNFKKLLNPSVIGGVAYGNNNANGIVRTFTVPFTSASGAYNGAVLAANGDLQFIPATASVGTRMSPANVLTTYSLVYTTTSAYQGGVLAANGDIHFVPLRGIRGQKISASGVVSTYSLVYTLTSLAYRGGVLAPNGDIHFIPGAAAVGQKISAAGVVSTYSLVYTTSSGAYAGGVLAPNGDIHFVPQNAPVGQKISAAGVVSTYSLVYTTSSGAYSGGVITPNGDIHFVPSTATVGQKISAAGVVSTYSLAYTTTSGASSGGVLAPNGDIHFINLSGAVGQRIAVDGSAYTYSLLATATNAYAGGVLRPDGSIVFSHLVGAVGQMIHTNPGIALGQEACLSSYLNKF